MSRGRQAEPPHQAQNTQGVQPDSETIREVAALLESGLPIAKAVRASAQGLSRLDLADKLRFENLVQAAEAFGGSILPGLEALARQMDFADRMASKIALARAVPDATARVVFWLPLVCLPLAQLLGINVMAGAVKTPVIVVSMMLGALLLWLNHKIMQRITTRALKETQAQVANSTLVGEALLQISAGVAPSRISAGQLDPDLHKLFNLASEHGLRLSTLLGSFAERQRLLIEHETKLRFERLPIKMLMPIGLLALPALALLAIIPVSITLITN